MTSIEEQLENLRNTIFQMTNSLGAAYTGTAEGVASAGGGQP